METNKKQLTDQQLRIIQIAVGIFSAVALFLSIYLPPTLAIPQDSLLNYVFVVVFLVIMMGRRSIENKYRLRLNLFSLTLMVGIFGAIIVFAATAMYNPKGEGIYNLDSDLKILIIVGLTLVFIGLGIVFPVVRYMKRKANGTVAPIRLPEKPEPVEGSEQDYDDPNRPLSIEEKIAAMSRELDEGQPDETEKDEK